MRIEQLEYLAAVTQHGSVRRASEQLHISQPAMSEALRNLERELGVTLLERRRSGARISPQGSELLQRMHDVLDAVERLKAQAQQQREAATVLRIGTVNAGTSALVVPALRAFAVDHPHTLVQVEGVQQRQLHERLAEGSLELGLVNVLPGDDTPPHLHAERLVSGRPVVCLRSDDPLAARAEITIDELAAVPLVGMRAGYVMHRYIHRLLGPDRVRLACVADGAEMGKVLVAEGLGVTVLPDYSIDSDPLVRSGVLTQRPIRGDDTTVEVLMLRRRMPRTALAVAACEEALRAAASAYTASAAAGSATDSEARAVRP